MCGIAGVLDFAGRAVETELLAAMSGSLRHRGPDGDGIYTEAGLGLVHRRLSIIDIEGGHQPMTTPDGNARIVFNGEIYNFKELRADLEGRGHRFATRSDTEVIIHLYEDKGIDCVGELRGMFAFAIWDPEKRLLLLARDRVGIKPLYYSFDGSRLLFASELKALLSHPDAPREVDPIAISEFLTYQYVPSPRTAFSGVLKLEPAHTLVATAGRIRLRRYWDVPGVIQGRSEGEWQERLDATLREAVRIHMRSDVPVGALLSGGIDSSLMVALASQVATAPIRTFSVGFEESDMSELPYARSVAERYGTRHTEYVLTPRNVDSLPTLVRHFDEPFGDPSALPCHQIAEVAARDVKVCLSGDGGDEAFAGYNAYATSSRLRRLDLVPLGLRRLLASPFERWLPEWVRGKGLLRLLTSPAADRYAELMVGVDCSTREWLLSPGFFEATSERHPYDRIRTLYRSMNGLDEVARLQRVDLHTYLPDDILVKADRTSMLHSLELRVPLLDSEVIELALQMPTRLKLHGGVRKRILKSTFGDLLPPAILTRGKQGFGIPQSAWLRGDLRSLVCDIFADARTRQRGILSPAGLDRLLLSSQRGSRDLGNEVWSVLVLELWLRSVVDGKAGVTGSFRGDRARIVESIQSM